MATSLARQLQKLAVPGQPSARQAQSKRKTSFLFDPREAADVDTTSVFNLACNGLEELISINPVFFDFRETLFHEKWCEKDRSTLLKDEEESLNQELDLFLLLLSPHFMLKCAHKCIEWLVRVFRVYASNTSSVMKCVLPHYQTVHFARMVSLLPIKDPSSLWHWLRPIQKSGNPLSQQTLINHCRADNAFLSFVCDLTIQSVQLHRTLQHISHPVLGLFAFCVISTIEQKGAIDETFVQRIVGPLMKGLKSKHVDFSSATLLIVISLSSRATLTDQVVQVLLETISKHIKSELEREQLIAIAHISKSHNVKLLSKRCITRLLMVPSLVEILDHLSSRQDCKHFVDLLLESMIHHYQTLKEETKRTKMIDILSSIIKMLPASQKSLKRITSGALSLIVHHQLTSDEVKGLVDILKTVSSKYCTVFDECISDCLRSSSEHKGAESALFKVLSDTLQGPSKILQDKCTTLSLAIRHPEEEVRKLATIELKKNLVKDDFTCQSLMAALNDPSETVVSEVLELSLEELLSVLHCDQLLGALMDVIQRGRNWKRCSVRCVEILSAFSFFSNLKVVDCHLMIANLLPHLFMQVSTWKTSYEMCVTLANSKLANQNPLLTGMAKLFTNLEWKGLVASNPSPDQIVDVNLSLLSWLTNNLVNIPLDQLDIVLAHFIEMLSADVNCQSYISFAVAGFVLSHFMRVTMEARLNLKIAGTLITHIQANSSMLTNTLVYKTVQLPQTPFPVMTLLNNSPSHTNLVNLQSLQYLWIMNVIIYQISIPNPKASTWLAVSLDGTEEDLYNMTMFSLFNILATVAGQPSGVTVEPCRELLKSFCKVHFSGRGWLLRFLAAIWTSRPDTVFSAALPQLQVTISLSHQMRAMSVGHAYLKSLEVESLIAMCSSNCPFVPSLMVPLRDHRLAAQAVECLVVVHDATEQLNAKVSAEVIKSTPFLHLVDLLVQHSFDVVSDPNHIKALLKKYFSDCSLRELQPSTPKLRKKSTKSEVTVLDSLLQHLDMESSPIMVRVDLLKHLSKVHSSRKLAKCGNILKGLLERDSLEEEDLLLVKAVLRCFNAKSAPYLGNAREAWTTLLSSLTHSDWSIQDWTIAQMSADLFGALPDDSFQLDLLDSLMSSALSNARAEYTCLVQEVLLQLPLTAGLVETELDKHREQLFPSLTHQKKKPKVKPTTNDEIWKKIHILLEVLVNRPVPLSADGHMLIPHFFGLLESILDEMENQETLEYSCGLVLIILRESCKLLLANQKHASDGLTEEQFNVDLVVQCIRMSDNASVHQNSLLLLSVIAELAPLRVLHNILPIFTFMGCNMMRHDDQYSFGVIQQTVDTIIPVLVQQKDLGRSGSDLAKRSRKSKNSLNPDGALTEILNVCVDTLPHVPAHRRLPIFTHLLQYLGATETLHAMWVLLMKKYISTSSKAANFSYLEFACQLSGEYTSFDIMSAILKVMQYLSTVPFEKPQRVTRTMHTGLFDVGVHSTKQLLHFRHSIYSLAGEIIEKQVLKKQSEMETSENSSIVIVKLWEVVLLEVSTLAEYHVSDNSTKRFFESVTRKSHDLVKKLSSLLTMDSFLEVVNGLITGTNSGVQCRGFEIYYSELISPRQPFTEAQQQFMLELVDVSVKVVTDSTAPLANLVSSVQCLKASVPILAEGHSAKYLAILKELFPLLSESALPSEVASEFLLFISVLVTSLQALLIPLIKDLMTVVLSHMTVTCNSDVVHSSMRLLYDILSYLARFISPHVTDIVLKVCQPDLLQNGQHVELLCKIREKLGTQVPLRIILGNLHSAYKELDKDSKESLICFVEILDQVIQQVTSDDVKLHQKSLLDTFLLLFEFRTEHSNISEMETVNEFENVCFGVFCQMVIKMSEVTFHPLFLKLQEWALNEGSPVQRMITFYHLMLKLVEKLKSIFLRFASHLIPTCTKLLDQLHNDHQGEPVFAGAIESHYTVSLLSWILQTLQKIFTFDKGDFVTKECFQTLLTPLTNQVTNMLSNKEDYLKHIQSVLGPCIAAFGVASSKDVFWKQLNQKLLLLSRHCNVQVRLSAISIMSTFYRQLGEEMIVLLPETIPYLAELLEDDYEEVELSVRTLISTIESLSGEPLNEYLTAN